MQKQSIDEITKTENYLKSLMGHSMVIARQELLAIDKQQLKYYKSFPDINAKYRKVEQKLSQIIKKIGNFVGIQNTKNLVKLQKTTQIIQQYTDNIEILFKKYTEQQQKLRVKKRRQNQLTIPAITTINLSKLKKPIRKQILKSIDLGYINSKLDIIPSQSLDAPLIYVDNTDLLNQMINNLLKSNQIAVDLQHSDKTYTGITSLIQISDRNQDYIIDVFNVWQQLHHLNKVFNNVQIVKVFHGAESDIFWLHRDFDIRVSNMFDTHQAARVLGHKQQSYAYLLKYYTNTDTDKKYQLADWRIRPLTQQMILYARTDTHYLLQIYDRMRNDIYKKSIQSQLEYMQILKTIWMKSYDISCIQYKQINFKYAQPYLSIMQKQRAFQSQQKVILLQKIFQIRQLIAQKQDMNSNQIFPRKYTFELADKKNFQLKSLEIYLKKAPQKLKKYFQLLSNQLTHIYEGLELKKKHQNHKMEIQVTQNKSKYTFKTDKIHQVQLKGMQQQELYFQFKKQYINFPQYEFKTLLTDKKKMKQQKLNFQCPLDFLINKYQIMAQQTQKNQEQKNQQIVEVIKQIQNKQVQQKIIYFGNSKNDQKMKTDEVKKFEPRISKKRKRETELEQKIRNKANVYSYLE